MAARIRILEEYKLFFHSYTSTSFFFLYSFPWASATWKKLYTHTKKKKKCFEMFKPVWLLFYVVSNSGYQYERKQNNNPWNWWAKFKLTRNNLKRILMLHWPYPLFCSRFLGESCLCEWFRGDQRPAQNNRGENFERQWLWSVWI